MMIFKRNKNETLYPDGKKHFADVIKNSGPGELLIWKNEEEDFNNNSTLIVAESEEALFFKDGIIEQVFEGGKYTLDTNNYPFISRIRNAFTGGISTFNCKVYFVRKAHSMEIFWGTDSPIQVRDPLQGIATSVQARGAYKIQVNDSKKFLLKLVGNNIPFMNQVELTNYFRSEFNQYIKSSIAKYIKNSNEEILGICAEQDMLASRISNILQDLLDDYGIRLVSFTIAGIDIPENDPNRQMLEESFARRGVRRQEAWAKREEQEILGINWAQREAAEILADVANNPGAGGVASAGAGVGMGMAAGGIFNGMAQQIFQPMQQPVQQPIQANSSINKNSSRFVQKDTIQTQNGIVCTDCGITNDTGAKFCKECGSKILTKTFCSNCGTEMLPTSKFCSECGARRG